jgi:hypothetical protein
MKDDGGGPTRKKPMRLTFHNSCARAAIGHTAAPPNNVMNCRRLIPFARSRDQSFNSAIKTGK